MRNTHYCCVARYLFYVSLSLSARLSRCGRRNEEFAQIVGGLELNHTDMDILHQFHHLFWMGDLAYRIVTDRCVRCPY
jgi:hypothetical protein